MKYTLSARNQFEGKVIDVNEGAVNGIVKFLLLLQLPRNL